MSSRQRLLSAVAPGHPLAGKRVSIKAMKGVRFVGSAAATPFYEATAQRFRAQGLAIPADYIGLETTDGLELISVGVAVGIGVPEFLLKRARWPWAPVHIRELESLEIGYGVFWAKGVLDPALEALLDAMKPLWGR